MPELPGGGGAQGIADEIQRHVQYPATALKENIEGKVFVNFRVGADGLVSNAKIVKGIGGGCNEAVLAAVRHLPRFISERELGHPSATNFTVPVTFRIE